MSDETLDSPEFAADALLAAVAAGETTLMQGAKNDSVVALQKALIAVGAGIKPDGAFGPKTRAALVAFQSAADVPQSGILDAETLHALDRQLVERRHKALLEAMADAVGIDPHRPVARPAPARPRAGTPTDASYFVDASALSPVGSAATEDPDSPPPLADIGPPLVASGTPLPADRQPMFGRIRQILGDDGPANAALARLLAAGRLHNGKLLPNLAALATTRRHPELLVQGGIEPELLLRQVVRHVDNPLRVRQGVGRGTCGAGVIEYLLLRRDPAEFVRVVDGITGFTGHAQLRSKRTIRLPRTAIPRDDTLRVDIDRLFQSTIMNHATAMSWLFDYDNPKDDESFWAAVQGNTQMPIWGLLNMYEDVMGERRVSATIASRPRDEIAEIVVARSLAGDRVPVILTFKSLHWVSVEWVVRGSDGRPTGLVLRNPWGWDEGQGPPPRVPLPEGGGRVRMKYADFISALVGAVVKE